MPWLNDLQAYLATAGVGTSGTDWFRTVLPDEPAAAAAIFAYAGRPGERTHDTTGVSYEHPSCQVVCRAASDSAADIDAATARAQLAYVTLTRVQNQTINGIRYQGIDAAGPPFMMGRDEQRRVLIACNYSLFKEPSA